MIPIICAVFRRRTRARLSVFVIDSRMLAACGTGVATYARVLANCLAAAGASPMVLDDGPAPARPALRRAGRWLSALYDGPRWASHAPPMTDRVQAAAEARRAVDVFREAQVFFNIHGRLLPIVCEAPPKVMHWTYPVPLYLQGAKNLYTVHDLIPIKHPDLTSISSARHERLLQGNRRCAVKFVTVSESVRWELRSYFACEDDRIVNTYQAVDVPLQRDPPLPAGLSRGSYFLFCGTIERRKNLVRLIEAYQASQVGVPLVLVGPDGYGAAEIMDAVAGVRRVIRLPWQSRDVLLALLRGARAVCFPTLAEGFGLPVAEAMTLGAPVLTSNRGALAEVAGEAALCVDPTDLIALARALRRLETDDRLRAELRAAGFVRARMFSLPVYAERLRLLYTDVAQEAASDPVNSRPRQEGRLMDLREEYSSWRGRVQSRDGARHRGGNLRARRLSCYPKAGIWPGRYFWRRCRQEHTGSTSGGVVFQCAWCRIR